MSRVVTLPPAEEPLADGAIVGGWWRTLDDGRLLCELCPRACHLKAGDRGFCFVRENRDGQLVLSTYGRSTGFCIDPIEKKPLNHFYPGTSVLSFGTAGCNLGCKFCQNWDISKSREIERLSDRATPEAIVAAAQQWGCRSVAFTYNDPVIWAEYAVDTARLCREAGIKTVAVTAGYIMPAARKWFYSAMDAANVDLKGFTEEFYFHYTLSHLEPVLDTLRWLKQETNVWFEITNLIIPRANDAPAEIEQMCDWILKHVGDEVPVHFTAFHPDFRLLDRPPTPASTLVAAYDIARRAGLKYVYVGNIQDVPRQSTYCPECRTLLIERAGYTLGTYAVKHGRCASCGAAIAGHFEDHPGNWGARRQPVRIGEFSRAALAPSAAAAASSSSPPTAGGGASTSTAPTTTPSSAPAQEAPSTAPGTAPGLSASPAMDCPSDVVAGQLAPSSHLDMDELQQQRLHSAACRWLAAALAGRQDAAAEALLGPAADLLLEGAFVTLKRQKHLRACCGVLGRPMRLADAVQQAALRTATADMRLPPLAVDELPFCHVDVTLLHAFQPVRASGRARIEAVEVGRHGLQIRRGAQAGLLLPAVARDQGWNAEQFLDHVCRKAGLPTSAWSEADVELMTFEGVTIPAPFGAETLADQTSSGQIHFTAEELGALAEHARANVVAHFLGGTPSYYLPGVPDGRVIGVALAVRTTERAAPLTVSQLSMRPGLPLQATLLNLTAAAARQLADERSSRHALHACQVDVTVLTDVAVHGTLADPDLRGLDPRRRAVVWLARDHSAWLYQPDVTAEQLVERAARVAPVQPPAALPLYSARVFSSAPEFVMTPAPRAASASRDAAAEGVRPAAVAGMFYPADATELARMVDDLLGPGEVAPGSWRAAMVPHAGLMYSGRIAAQVLRNVRIPETVIVLAPKHTRLGIPWAVAPHAAWAIPGAEIASDVELGQQLVEGIEGLAWDAAAHQREHAIEVELPLFHRLAPQTRVVGIVIGQGDRESCRRFGRQLAEVVRKLDPPPLLVISSDMNHFATDGENRRLDRLALDAMARLEPDELYETVMKHRISMCGVLPAVIVMHALQHLGGLDHFHQVAYGTSADVSGDTSRVVGYAGVLLK